MNQVEPIRAANGTPIQIPLFDPVVAHHFGEASSYTKTLLDEIFIKRIYAPLFDDKVGLTFLDIGANIGLVSLYASDACKRIVAIEPAQKTFDVLKSMTLKYPKIESHRFALTNVDGPAEFFVNDENTTASSTVNTFGRFTEVPGLTLPTILSAFQLEHVDICKLDCEGGESKITPEQWQVASDVIDCLFIEFHNAPRVEWQEVMANTKALLYRCGFTLQDTDGMRLLASK